MTAMDSVPISTTAPVRRTPTRRTRTATPSATPATALTISTATASRTLPTIAPRYPTRRNRTATETARATLATRIPIATARPTAPTAHRHHPASPSFPVASATRCAWTKRASRRSIGSGHSRVLFRMFTWARRTRRAASTAPWPASLSGRPGPAPHIPTRHLPARATTTSSARPTSAARGHSATEPAAHAAQIPSAR